MDTKLGDYAIQLSNASDNKIRATKQNRATDFMVFK